MKPVGGIAVFVALLSACGSGASSRAQCPAPGIRVDVQSLPRGWVERGTFTLCRDDECNTQSSPFSPYYGRGPFFAGSIDDKSAVAVSLRVDVDGHRVVDVHTAAPVRPSATQRAEVSETCGALIDLVPSVDRTTLEPRA